MVGHGDFPVARREKPDSKFKTNKNNNNKPNNKTDNNNKKWLMYKTAKEKEEWTEVQNKKKNKFQKKQPTEKAGLMWTEEDDEEKNDEENWEEELQEQEDKFKEAIEAEYKTITKKFSGTNNDKEDEILDVENSVADGAMTTEDTNDKDDDEDDIVEEDADERSEKQEEKEDASEKMETDATSNSANTKQTTDAAGEHNTVKNYTVRIEFAAKTKDGPFSVPNAMHKALTILFQHVKNLKIQSPTMEHEITAANDDALKNQETFNKFFKSFKKIAQNRQSRAVVIFKATTTETWAAFRRPAIINQLKESNAWLEWQTIFENKTEEIGFLHGTHPDLAWIPNLIQVVDTLTAHLAAEKGGRIIDIQKRTVYQRTATPPASAGEEKAASETIIASVLQITCAASKAKAVKSILTSATQEEKCDLTFIPFDLAQHDKNAYCNILKSHNKLVESTKKMAVYGLDPELFENNDGESLKEFILTTTKRVENENDAECYHDKRVFSAIERTHKTLTEGKYFFLYDATMHATALGIIDNTVALKYKEIAKVPTTSKITCGVSRARGKLQTTTNKDNTPKANPYGDYLQALFLKGNVTSNDGIAVRKNKNKKPAKFEITTKTTTPKLAPSPATNPWHQRGGPGSGGEGPIRDATTTTTVNTTETTEQDEWRLKIETELQKLAQQQQQDRESTPTPPKETDTEWRDWVDEYLEDLNDRSEMIEKELTSATKRLVTLEALNTKILTTLEKLGEKIDNIEAATTNKPSTPKRRKKEDDKMQTEDTTNATNNLTHSPVASTAVEEMSPAQNDKKPAAARNKKPPP
jgi:hypothetical protein